MIACGKEDRDLREKNTDGDEGFKTLECLRGRLQAERQASRSAKRDAELMGNKLAELEKQLKQELRLKKRAEKKLILLKKKLESMKGSSTNSTNQEEQEQDKSQIRNPEISQKMEDNASESSSSNSKSTDPSSSKSTKSYEYPKNNRDSFSSSSMASKSEIEMDGGEFVDDTWALVPVTWPAAVEPRVVSGSVDEVLDVLRRAREGLKCSMEKRRNFIRVGPACN